MSRGSSALQSLCYSVGRARRAVSRLRLTGRTPNKTRRCRRRQHDCEYLEDRLVIGSALDLVGGILSGLSFPLSAWGVSAPETTGVDIRSTQQEMPEAGSFSQGSLNVPPPPTCLDSL